MWKPIDTFPFGTVALVYDTQTKNIGLAYKMSRNRDAVDFKWDLNDEWIADPTKWYAGEDVYEV